MAATLLVGAATAPSASAVPRDPKSVTIAQQCTDGTGTILTMHPGLGKALWDVTTQVVSARPSYLIKSLVQDVYENGQYTGTFTYDFGQKVGLSDVFTCTYTESFTTPEGVLMTVVGASVKVRL